MKIIGITIVAIIYLFSCNQKTTEKISDEQINVAPVKNKEKVDEPKANPDAKNDETVAYIEKANLYDYDVAYFASGCFWCVEAVYETIPGVVEAIAGYSGGHTDFVNYTLSGTGKTGHAEAVAVFYDAENISYAELVKIYFASQDIEQELGQGPDFGSEYRSILFYQTDAEKEIIDSAIKDLSEEGFDVAAEVQAFEQFFVAEDYHQDFKKRNPNHPYIKNISNKRLKEFQEKYY